MAASAELGASVWSQSPVVSLKETATS